MIAMRLVAATFSILFFIGNTGAQLPPVAIIDYYGLRKVPLSEVRAALPIKPGDDAFATLAQKDTIIQRLRSIPNVEDASIELVCCDDNDAKSMVFVGIQERGVPAAKFRQAPKGAVRLPALIVALGDDFQAAFLGSVADKDFSEDDSQGHALFGNQKVRRIQIRFSELATANVAILRKVIHESSDGGQRALAAQVIAYSQDKRSIVPDLVYAMGDPDRRARNEAMRALLIIAKYSRTHRELGIRVPTAPFVKMLNSLVWTDRNKSAGAIEILSVERDPPLMNELRRSAVDSLAEMAKWTNPGHAEPSFRILGRLAGLNESEIRSVWTAKLTRSAKVQQLLNRIMARK